MKKFQTNSSSTPKAMFVCKTSTPKKGQASQVICQVVTLPKNISQNVPHAIKKTVVSNSSQKVTECNTTDPSCQNYQQIYDDFWPDATGAIEHQFEWQELSAANKVVEVEREFFIPLDTIVPGTELVSGASVYGYNSDGSLDLTGGKAKTYDPNYKGMNLRYHGALEAKYYPNIVQPLSFMTPNISKEYFERVVSYFTARGYTMPAPDNFKQFSDQYVWSFSAGQNQFFNLSNAFIAMRFIYAKCNKIPTYVDLHASANPNNSSGEYVVMDTYQPDPSQQENGHGYPLRITITKDSSEFNQLKNTQPIAYFDCKCKVLTIHVPENTEGYFYTHRIISGTGFLDFEYTEYLTAFDGSFSLLNKTCVNGLKCANFCKLDVLAQVSENVLVKGRAITDGSEEIFESNVPIRSAILSPDDPTVYYTGVVAPKMNGSSSSFDFYALPVPITSSYTSNLDPIQYPSTEYFDQHHDEGDNPVTKVVERYSVSASITGFDNDVWNRSNFSLPYDVITATTSYPENLTTTPAPSTLSLTEAYKPVIMHEFTHSTQYESGLINFLPAEAMAVGIEMDTRAVENLFGTVRARRFAQIHLRLTRGDFTMMKADSESVTFGMGMFWKYTHDQFDFNQQLQRRAGDILTSETLGPLLQSNSIPDLYATFPINRTGGSAALRDSLQQLFGRNIKDLWNDFSIAMVLMRNNTSIPSQYQVGFPYWIYDSQYAGYLVLQSSLTFLGTPQFADWWEKLDDNQIVPANYGVTIATGQTFIRTLPQNFTTNLKNLTTVSFTVPNNLNTVTVNITAGEWRITLLQFTSDGTPVGSFIIDGPHAILGAGSHVFNISTHIPAFTANGSIRLVCANVTFSGTGTTSADYFSPEPTTGSISIISA